MRRRTLLASIGTATALTAGCLGRGQTSEPTDTTGSSDTTSTSDTTTVTTTADPATDGPGATPQLPVADLECPSFAEDVDRTVCWPGDVEGEPLYLDASSAAFEPTTGDGSVETIEFVLHNGSKKAFGLNPHGWTIHRWTGDGWSFVAPGAHVEPWYMVAAGETYTWRLSVEQHSAPMSEDSMAIVQDLAAGNYAFQITGAFGDGPDSGTRVECVARFEVQRGG